MLIQKEMYDIDVISMMNDIVITMDTNSLIIPINWHTTLFCNAI